MVAPHVPRRLPQGIRVHGPIDVRIVHTRDGRVQARLEWTEWQDGVAVLMRRWTDRYGQAWAALDEAASIIENNGLDAEDA
jgi:hypothetical protein